MKIPRFRHIFYSFLILLTFLTVCYCVLRLIDVHFDMLLLKVKWTLFSKSFHFLFSRLGWCTGGLIFLVIFSLFDPETVENMMAPSGANSEKERSHIFKLWELAAISEFLFREGRRLRPRTIHSSDPHLILFRKKF